MNMKMIPKLKSEKDVCFGNNFKENDPQTENGNISFISFYKLKVKKKILTWNVFKFWKKIQKDLNKTDHF